MLSEKRIRDILVEIVKPLDGKLEPDAALGSTDGWDSLAQLELIVRLEQESGIKLSAEDSIYAESLPDLLALFGDQKNTGER